VELLRRSVVLAAVGAAFGLVGADAASAAARCPKAPEHVVARAPVKADGYAYRVGHVLFGCGRVTADRPLRVWKLGPWTPESQALYTDGGVVWTERRTSPRGLPEDRIWVSALAGRPSVRGLASVRKASDRVVAKVLPGPAWVTAGGAVAVARPMFDDPELIGAGTPGAAGTDGAAGLVRAPKVSGARLELGRWGAAAVPALIATLSVVGDGVDADGCSVVTAFEAQVVPVAGEPAVGASWQESERFEGIDGCD
jgi:hypothetical protein